MVPDQVVNQEMFDKPFRLQSVTSPQWGSRGIFSGFLPESLLIKTLGFRDFIQGVFLEGSFDPMQDIIDVVFFRSTTIFQMRTKYIISCSRTSTGGTETKD